MGLDRNSKIGIIGSGFVGGSLAVALSRVGYNVIAASSRRFVSAEALAQRIEGCKAFVNSQEVIDVSDVVFLTTPDDSNISYASSCAIIYFSCKSCIWNIILSTHLINNAR